jgi:hypothetical protein
LHDILIDYSTILSASFKSVIMMRASFQSIKAAYNLRTQIAKNAEQIAEIVCGVRKFGIVSATPGETNESVYEIRCTLR